jgi:peptide/nickel transport system ATP-binding protein
MTHLLDVRDLSVEFHTALGTVHAVKRVSFHLDRGETLAILGESGSGKSVSSSAIMDLIDMPPGKITSGQILFDGRDLLKLPASARRDINGRRIAMIFQDPLSHLNPVYTVGWQIEEALTAHGADRATARAEALRLVARVGIPNPADSLKKYPHEFSGGQRQRLMIAMALALKPDLLIADEPTTALDVTVQAEVLALLEELQHETGMGILIITHDLGVVAEIADRVVVMNAGEVVETGETAQVYRNPQHPYTARLIGAAPGKGEMHMPGRAGAVGPQCPQGLWPVHCGRGRVLRPDAGRDAGHRRRKRLGQVHGGEDAAAAGRADGGAGAVEGARPLRHASGRASCPAA